MGNIKNIKYIGEEQTYDLEVNHKDHQFYLANGVLTSNSHAVCYSMISYQTAYLKAHFPIEFLLANLMQEVKSNGPMAEENLVKIKNEIKVLGVKIIPPDINKSLMHYELLPNNQLLTGLEALKYVSDDAIKDIIAKRPFKSFQDFMSRIDSRKVRANAIQALAACGCLDSFKIPRHLIFLYCSDYRKKIQVWMKKHDPSKEEFIYPWSDDKGWSISELYALEYFYLGEAFCCGLKQAYGDFFKNNDFTFIKEIKQMKNKTNIPSIKGVIKDLFAFKVKKEGSKFYGQNMLKLSIEDINGDICNITVFPDRYKLLQDLIQFKFKNKIKFEPGVAIHCGGQANLYDGEIGIILNETYDIKEPPQKPSDLKHRKVWMKRKDKSENLSLEEEIEEELILEGVVDDVEEFLD